jgi:two-component system invasion response regulator UvrY
MIRVLVVDDSPAFLNAAADVVAVTPGFELAGTARSGEEAIVQAAAMKPDLVLLDLRMPGIGGREAAALITQAQPTTGIVLMTADSGRSAAAGPRAAEYAVVDKRTLAPAVLTAVWDSLRR